MCVCPLGPLTAALAPDLGGIDGAVSPGSQVHLSPKASPSDEWLSHKHKIVDRIYKQFIFHVPLTLLRVPG